MVSNRSDISRNCQNPFSDFDVKATKLHSNGGPTCQMPIVAVDRVQESAIHYAVPRPGFGMIDIESDTLRVNHFVQCFRYDGALPNLSLFELEYDPSGHMFSDVLFSNN